MIYLIGGAPRCGKTTTAKALSKELGVPWISTDTLESVVAQYVPDSESDALFPKTKMRRATNRDNDLMYSTFSPAEIADAYHVQGKSLWPAIIAFAQQESLYDHHYIFEGHHIHPELVSKLVGCANIRALFVGQSDLPTTIADITENKSPNDWIRHESTSAETISKIAEMITLFSATLESEAAAQSATYISMDDYPTGIQRSFEYLKSTSSILK